MKSIANSRKLKRAPFAFDRNASGRIEKWQITGTENKQKARELVLRIIAKVKQL